MTPQPTIPPPPPTAPSTASTLKSITSLWPSVLNARDPYHLSPTGRQISACIHPTRFTARIDGYPGTFTFPELQSIWAQEIADNPTNTIELVDASVDVDEKLGVGTCYLELDFCGLGGDGVKLKGFTEVRWQREERDGTWLIWSFQGLRGWRAGVGFV